MIDAFLAVEDKEFYRHDGVNVRSLVRATLSNFASDSPQQGASTITMQVVKNDFLAGLERDGRYKLLQVHYALMLERENTKDEILERYLNTVFFGNNAYGIQAAAETYFGKTADQLTFIEAAFLAGLVRSPSGYDPINNPERSRGPLRPGARPPRRRRLHHRGRGRPTLATDFVLPDRGRARSPSGTYTADLLHRGAARLPAQPLEHPRRRRTRSATTRCSAAACASTRRSTRSSRSQAENARNVLPDTPQGFDAAIVSLDTTTGAIRAMVGGRGFVPSEREIEHGARAPPDRLEHQVVRPRRRAAGRRPARRHHRRPEQRARSPCPTSRAVRDHGRRRAGRRTRSPR